MFNMTRTRVAVIVAPYPRGLAPKGARRQMVEPCVMCNTPACQSGREDLLITLVRHGRGRCPLGRRLRVVWDPET